MHRLLPAALVLASACAPHKQPLHLMTSPGPEHDTVVVLLPGLFAHDETFVKQGVLDALREGGVEADVVMVDATFPYYVRETLHDHLETELIPWLDAHYDHVWVLGISMGGVGALLTWHWFPESVDGLVLFSPFLGRGKTMKALRAHETLTDWTPGAPPTWDEALWTDLRALETAPSTMPPVYLGYGTHDLGDDHAWFATLLPPDHVRVVEGGHTWSVWSTLARDVAGDLARDQVAFGAPVRFPVERSEPPPPAAVSSPTP